MTDSRTRVYGRSPSSFEVKCPVPPIPGSWPSVLILTATGCIHGSAQIAPRLRNKPQFLIESAISIAPDCAKKADSGQMAVNYFAFFTQNAEIWLFYGFG
jgi:hypothetical protein